MLLGNRAAGGIWNPVSVGITLPLVPISMDSDSFWTQPEVLTPFSKPDGLWALARQNSESLP